MFFLPPSYREVFTDIHTFQDNPLAILERRRSDRRLSDKIVLFVCLAALFGAIFFTIWVWDRVQFITHHIPPFLGGNYGSMLFIAVSGVHVWFVSFTAHRRTNTYFLQEYRRGSLQALLSTAFTPFQLVLQAAVFPFFQAMLVAAAGLPFYLYFLNLGGISSLELVLVYVIFAMMAFAPPRWRVPVFGGLAPQDIQRKKKRGRGTTGWELAISAIMLQGVFGWMLSPLFGTGWNGRLIAPLGDLFEKNVAVFWPTVFISWPLMLAKWMLTPITFYSIKLPPILFVLPLYLLAQLLGIWHTSLYLRVEDEKQAEKLWDLPAFWRLRFAYTLFAAFVALGYLWRPYVASKVTASLITWQFARPGQELEGLFWIMCLSGAFMFWERIFRFRQANAQVRSPFSAEYAAAELRWCLPPFVGMLGLFVLGVVFARQNPFLPDVLAILPGGCIAALAGGLIVRTMAGDRGAYVALIVFPLVAFLIPGLEWAAGLSPVAGFLALTPHMERIANVISPFHPTAPAWYIPIAVGTGVSLVALLKQARRHIRTERPVEADAIAPIEDGVEPPPRRRRVRDRKEHLTALALIAWVQRRFDNAVAIKELRVLLRGRLGRGEIVVYFVLFLIPILAGASRPDILATLMDMPSQVFYGAGIPTRASFFMQLSTLYCFICSLALPLIAANSAASAFGKERDRSTLGFVLITPMSTGSILSGKLFGVLLPSVLVMLGFVLFNLVLGIGVMCNSGFLIAAAGVLLTTAIPLLLYLAGAMFGILAASILRKETDAGSLAIFASMGFVGLVFYVDFVVGGMDGRTSVQEATLFWLLCLATLSVLVSVVCGALAFARLEMMRGGDIKFGPGGKR